jgi:hypothetical protein
MTISEERQSLADAHHIIETAFRKQLQWWVFIPFIGIPRILRRQKLLRIGQYLVDRSLEIKG